MSPDVAHRLELHRSDFERVHGKPFEHFFCPILGVDEPIVYPNRLIEGHVINRAFRNTPRDWVVQRQDVDSFYGSRFEADFETLQHRNKLNPVEVYSDPTLVRKLDAKILLNDKPVEQTFQPSPPPTRFTRLQLGEEPNSPSVTIKMTQQEVAKAAGERWEFEIDKDLEIPALASLIKAAHLTMFHLVGYRYATSATGLFIGRDILGEFFKLNVGRPRKEALATARTYFQPFTNMINEIARVAGWYQGTIRDNRVAVCYSTSGPIWAFIVLIPTDGRMHAVMLPAFDFADAVPTFLGFLRNDNDRIEVATGEYDSGNRRWTVFNDRMQQRWPKRGDR
jgi:hypothetical protein